MAKYPSEIFGYHHSNRSPEATQIRNKGWCPFVNQRCSKGSRLITDRPFGVCTAHVNGNEFALCPRRFLDGHVVFKDIAKHKFNTTNDILIFPEIEIKGIGNLDYVMVKHKPLSAEIEDFAAVEFQTAQTTQTGKLVQGFLDYLAGKSVAQKSYNFGINSYDIWKRTFTQILTKGVVMEHWGKKIYWVVQEPVYRYFEARYHLQNLTLDEDHSTIFSLYDLKPGRERFKLVSTRKISASMDILFDAFRNNPDIPSLDEFLNNLKEKIASHAYLSLNFDNQH